MFSWSVSTVDLKNRKSLTCCPPDGTALYSPDLDEEVAFPFGASAWRNSSHRPNRTNVEDGASGHSRVSGAVPPQDGTTREPSTKRWGFRVSCCWDPVLVCVFFGRWRSSGTTSNARLLFLLENSERDRPLFLDTNTTSTRTDSSTGSAPTPSKSSQDSHVTCVFHNSMCLFLAVISFIRIDLPAIRNKKWNCKKQTLWLYFQNVHPNVPVGLVSTGAVLATFGDTSPLDQVWGPLSERWS